MNNLINNDEISRAGKKWLPEEDEKLLEEINDKLSYDMIALKHKRILRVVSHIIYPKYKKENISIDELVSIYNMDKELLEKYILYAENKPNIKESIKNNKED
jgi:hypothetical protein